MCGENIRPIQVSSVRLGSPPRVRGKPNCYGWLKCIKRITPACAGKTLTTVPRPPRQQDHPRVCGENEVYIGRLKALRGSPPRVRGKPLTSSKKSTLSRITPACAGKTGLTLFAPASSQDHPRVCGENRYGTDFAYELEGSPPRVRGKQPARDYVFASPRITPACAGKTRKQNGFRH